MAKTAQARSVGVFLHVTRLDGEKVPRIPVHSHQEAWKTAWGIMDDPTVKEVSARVGR